MVFLPASWIMIGVASIFIGLGRLNSLGWIYLGFIFIVIYMGDLLQFSDAVRNISAFEHVVDYPIESFEFMSSLILSVIAAVFMVFGLWLYRRRDVEG
ncbi:hypothetical protein [Piscibacillus salipiscarius]|nr:hypothetical protein [Piscibacillus salipiscarius]